jgi:hypothetical protein
LEAVLTRDISINAGLDRWRRGAAATAFAGTVLVVTIAIGLITIDVLR